MDAFLNLEGGIHFVFAWILLLLYWGYISTKKMHFVHTDTDYSK